MLRVVKMVKLYCLTNDIKYKDLAKQLGLSPSTMTRFFETGAIDSNGLAKIIKWLLEEV